MKPVKKPKPAKKGKKIKRKPKSVLTSKTSKSKGGNVSQVVNVYVNKAVRNKKSSLPKRIQQAPQLQPTYTAGQNTGFIQELREQNDTLKALLNKQKVADTTPNSDVIGLDDLTGLIRQQVKNATSRADTSELKETEYDDTTIYEGSKGFKVKETRPRKTKVKDTGVNVLGVEDLDDFIDLGRDSGVENVVINQPQDRENISFKLTEIARNMSDIPQGQRIAGQIDYISRQLNPQTSVLKKDTSIRVRSEREEEMDNIKRLELTYKALVDTILEARKTDKSIPSIARYTQRLPKEANTLAKHIEYFRSVIRSAGIEPPEI